MSEETPKLDVVSDDSEPTPEELIEAKAEEIAQISQFWAERCKVVSVVLKTMYEEDEDVLRPTPDGLLQAMSLYELPGRLVATHHATQQKMMQQMQSKLATAAPGFNPNPQQLKKGPRRKKR